MYDGTEETFDSLLFYLLRVTLGRQGDVFDIYTFLAFSFPLFWRKTLPSCNTGMDKKFCICKESGRKQKKKKRKTNIPKRKKPVGFCGTFGRPCRALALRWHNQILDGEILRGNGRHPAKKGLPARGEWKGHVGPWFCDGHTKFFAWNKQDWQLLGDTYCKEKSASCRQNRRGGEAMQGPVMATPTTATGLSSATAGKASVRPSTGAKQFCTESSILGIFIHILMIGATITTCINQPGLTK